MREKDTKGHRLFLDPECLTCHERDKKNGTLSAVCRCPSSTSFTCCNREGLTAPQAQSGKTSQKPRFLFHQSSCPDARGVGDSRRPCSRHIIPCGNCTAWPGLVTLPRPQAWASPRLYVMEYSVSMRTVREEERTSKQLLHPGRSTRIHAIPGFCTRYTQTSCKPCIP